MKFCAVLFAIALVASCASAQDPGECASLSAALPQSSLAHIHGCVTILYIASISA